MPLLACRTSLHCLHSLSALAIKTLLKAVQLQRLGYEAGLNLLMLALLC